MNERSNRIDWLVFFALGFMWGSSYLFIKLAVDDFGTFTLVALRLVVGAVLLWTVVRLAQQPLPRERADLRPPAGHGHHQHHDPVPADHLGRAVGRVVAGGDPDLAGAAVRDRPVVDLPRRRADAGQRRHRARSSGSSAWSSSPAPGLTGAGSSVIGELALLGAAFSYACGAVYSRRNVRGLAPMIPAVFQVSFAAIITGIIALLFEHPWTATPDAEAIFSILWLGILGSGLAYLAVFRLFAALGRDPDDARRLPHPGRRDRARLPRPGRARRRADHRRDRRW